MGNAEIGQLARAIYDRYKAEREAERTYGTDSSEWHEANEYVYSVVHRTVYQTSAAQLRTLMLYLTTIDEIPMSWIEEALPDGVSIASILDGATSAIGTSTPQDRTVQALRSMPYAEYLQTEHWRVTRGYFIQQSGGRCQVCNSTTALDVHHRTYENVGDEQPGDCTVLCRDCHSLFHQNKKLQ